MIRRISTAKTTTNPVKSVVNEILTFSPKLRLAAKILLISMKIPHTYNIIPYYYTLSYVFIQ
jgi:hypothetical protein